MEALNFVFTMIGAAINGAIQVFTDLLNLIIDVLPNPDPFPQIIEEMPSEVTIDKGFVLFWIDKLIGVNNAEMLLTTFTVLWLASLSFAVCYWVAKFIKT